MISYHRFSCPEDTKLLENQKGERIQMKRVPLFAKPNLAKTIKPTESNYGNDSVLQNYFFFRINELFRKKIQKLS